ncbi:hypothetical protein AO381_1234 [Moraxella catarrhalis]|nr:hypothetical protein AO381_1234 [Moraxella catarrhalis]
MSKLDFRPYRYLVYWRDEKRLILSLSPVVGEVNAFRNETLFSS